MEPVTVGVVSERPESSKTGLCAGAVGSGTLSKKHDEIIEFLGSFRDLDETLLCGLLAGSSTGFLHGYKFRWFLGH
jgi:hypothetical protein